MVQTIIVSGPLSGGQINLTYDPTHGGAVKIEAPAVGGVRPTRNIEYQTVAGAALPQRIRECATAAECPGSAVETVTEFAFDTSLNLVAQTLRAGNSSIVSTTSMSYDPVGNLLTVDGPLAGAADTTRYRYDAARRLIGEIAPDPDGAGPLGHAAKRHTYDPVGRTTRVEVGTVASQSDAHWNGFQTVQQLDTAYLNGFPIRQVLYGGGQAHAVTDTAYDSSGRPVCRAQRMNPAAWAWSANACQPDAEGAHGPDRIRQTIYDGLGRPHIARVAVGTPAQADEVTQHYSPHGELQAVVDGEGNRTTYEYDGHGRLARTRYPVVTKGANTSSTTDFEQLVYDVTGNITQRRLRDGQIITYTYDALNRVIYKNVPNTVIHEYDVSYGYDLMGGLTQAINTNGHVVNIGYDALRRRVSEQSNWTTRTFQYDATGRRTRLSWGDGFFVDYDYRVTGEMIRIRENGATAGVGVLATYNYDALGRRLSLVRGNGTTTTYGFDAASRLSTLAHDLSGAAYDIGMGFTHNPAQEIASITRSNNAYAWAGAVSVNRNYTVDGLNRYTAAGAVPLGYDARGNVTSSGGNNYSYTSENRLATAPGGNVMTYDPLGRYHWIASGPVTWMQYDGINLIEERTESGVARRYVHGPAADEPVVWYEGAGINDRRWLHADERGSVIAVTGSDGNVIANGINTYDEYGIPGATNVGRFQFTGQAWVPELGMYYYKARTYSPTLGRFLQTDPIGYGDGINLYNYAAGDPINMTDPSGLKVRWVCVGDGVDWSCGFKDDGAGGGGAQVKVSFEGGGAGNGARGPSPRNRTPKAIAPQKSKISPCQQAINEPGAVDVTLTAVDIVFGIGITGSLGSFRNIRTGTTGNFFSFGFAAGLSGGADLQVGRFRSVGDLVGWADSVSASGPGLGGFLDGLSGTISKSVATGDLIGGSGGAGEGVKWGLQGSLTDTNIYNCQVGE